LRARWSRLGTGGGAAGPSKPPFSKRWSTSISCVSQPAEVAPPAVTKRIFADWLGRRRMAPKRSNPGLCHRFDGAPGRWALPAQRAGRAALRGRLRVAGNGPALTSEGWFWRRFGAGFGTHSSVRALFPAPPARSHPQTPFSSKRGHRIAVVGRFEPGPCPGYRGENFAVTGRYGPLTAALLTVTRAGGRWPPARTGGLSARETPDPSDGWELVVRNPWKNLRIPRKMRRPEPRRLAWAPAPLASLATCRVWPVATPPRQGLPRSLRP